MENGIKECHISVVQYDVRSVTYDKYELTGRWIKKLAPDLMLDQMTRTDLQMKITARL